MPRGDGTGPQGRGSKTGRGMGSCGAKAAQKPTAPRGQGKGLGRGLGQGRKNSTGNNKINP